MFGTMKKALTVAAVIAAGVAAAPAVAAAGPVWNTDATSTMNAEPAHGTGELTLTVVVGGTPRTTTCDVTVTVDLWNAEDDGTIRGLGDVTTFLLGDEIPGGECTTSLDDCTVTATANTSTPWSITALTPADATISGVAFANTYAGPNCVLDGATINATGSVTGSVTSGLITFSSAGGLTTPLGPATVDGSVALLWEDDSSAVTLS